MITALLIGLIGLAAGLALPFAPVHAERAEIAWPGPGQRAVSSTAILVPYRPARLTAVAPCSALLAATALPEPVTVLATGGSLDVGGGVAVRVDGGQALVLVNSRLVAQADLPEPAVVPEAAPDVDPASPAGDCGARITAAAGGVDGGPSGGVEVVLAGRVVRLPGEPVPEVASFRTELDPDQAAGLTVRARAVNPFATSRTGLKTALLLTQLLAVVAALALLWRRHAGRPGWPEWLRPSPRLAWLVDGGVLGVLGTWAVLGPLSDDDGFATMIARNSALAGDQANYYRWWNASEAPFALVQHVLAVLTEVSLAPLWLRLPSIALGAAAWFALSRGVLGAVPGLGAGRVRVRLLAAVCFLAGWLPYDLGVRPEPYLVLGLTLLLALLWRARTPAGLGVATLVAAMTMTVSPTGLLVAAPIVVFAGKIRRILRGTGTGADGTSRRRARGVLALLADLALLGGIAAVALSVVFADQTLHGVLTATRWHTEFGPSLPWSAEFSRYQFLLGDDQDGTAAKRLPVLLAYALLPVVGVALARRGDHDPRNAAAARLAGVVALGFGLLWLTPSKWTHHFGAMAGVFAAFLVVSAVTLSRHAREQPTHRPLDRTLLGAGVVGAVLVAVAAGLTFGGPNAWWQPAVYAVPWPDGPVRPLGLALDSPLLWLAGAGLVAALVRLCFDAVAARTVVAAAPGLLAVTAAGVGVAVLLYSFSTAPLRRPVASLASANLEWLSGGPGCGLADDIQVLPDTPGGVLAPAGGSASLTGFAAGAGFGRYDPPEPPGVGASAFTWGSRVDGAARTGRMVSQWFTLPTLAPDQELAMTVSGRTDEGNRLALEFGRAADSGTADSGTTQPGTAGDRSGPVTALAERALIDRPHHDPTTPPDREVWRSVWLPSAGIPPGADRVRVLAADGSADPDGWLAFTGPRLREVVGLTDYLAGAGPVLVNWPIAFLFPCVRHTVGVAHGVVEAPRVVLEAPGQYADLAAASTAPQAGGDFAVLRGLGRLGELPSRVVGHPELDWGSVRLVDYRADGQLAGTSLARDRFRLTLSSTTIPGWRGDDAQFVTESK